jgi:hypothetical protein
MESGLGVPSTALESVAIVSLQGHTIDTSEALTNVQVRRLVQAHDQLVHIVAPAKPGTLILLESERSSGRASPLGPVPRSGRLHPPARVTQR